MSSLSQLHLVSQGQLSSTREKLPMLQPVPQQARCQQTPAFAQQTALFWTDSEEDRGIEGATVRNPTGE